MSRIILPTHWTQQPQYPLGIDRSNPITNGLCVAVIASPSPYDALSNKLKSSSTGTPTNGVGVAGLNRGYTGTQLDKFTTPESLDALTSYTFFQLSRYNKTGSYPGFIAKQKASDAQAIEVWQDTTPDLRMQHGGSNAILTGLIGALSTTTQNLVIITWDGTTVNSYVDGVLKSSVAFSVAVPTGNGSFTPLGRVASTTSTGEYYLSGMYSRCITADEIEQLSANPWQLFQPSTRTLPASAGGGSSLSGDGVATGSIVGASSATSAVSGTGVATAAGIGASTAASASSGDGVSTASGIGASIAASVSSGDGVATSSIVGASLVSGSASGSGIATSSIVGAGSAAGSASASGNGIATSSIVGASSATASVSGDGVATASFVSPSLNISTVSGGWEHTPIGRPLTKKELRKRFKLDEEETEVIETLAYHQAQDLSLTEKQRGQEAKQAFKIKGLTLETRYLQAINAQRESLINAEIAKILSAKQIEIENKEFINLILMAVAA